MSAETVGTIVANLGIGLFFLVAGFLVAPAIGFVDRRSAPHSDTLRVVRAGAERVTQRISRRNSGQARSSSQLSDHDRLIVGFIVVVGVITLYMRFRVEVLFGISVIALTTSLAAVVSLVVMSRNSVIAGTSSFIFTILGILMSFAVGIVDVWLLWHPFVGDETLQSFVQTFEQTGIFGDMDGAIYVLYQILGAGLYLVVAVFCIGFSIAVLSAINLHIRAWGAWFWRLAFRYTSGAWSRWAFGLGIFCSILSILLVGGLIYELVRT